MRVFNITYKSYSTFTVSQKRLEQEPRKKISIPAQLNHSHLETQQAMFKICMKSNCEATCVAPFTINPLIKMRRILSTSRHLQKLIPKYFKLAEIGSILILGLVEDERCFPTLKFLKSCHRNRLEKHMPLVVRMFGQQYFSLKNFLFTEAIDSWRDALKHGQQGDA